MKKTTLAIILSGALLAGSAMAHQAGDVMFRAGAVHVKANSSSDAKSKAATGIDVDLKVKNNTQLGLTATYMLADNVGIELLGATPFSHKINAKAKVLESGAEVDLDRVVILKQLPPSLYAQYYFFEPTAKVKPYVGAGLNYTRFYHAKSVSPAVTDLSVKKHSFGPVANLGVDVKLTDNIYFNAAAWYTRIKTTAKFKAAGADHEVKVKLDPVVLFAGFGVKF